MLRKGNPRDSRGWGRETRRPRSEQSQGRGQGPGSFKELRGAAGRGRRARSGLRGSAGHRESGLSLREPRTRVGEWDPLCTHQKGTGRARASSAGSRVPEPDAAGVRSAPPPLLVPPPAARGGAGAELARLHRGGAGAGRARRGTGGEGPWRERRRCSCKTTPALVGRPCRPTLAAAGGAEPRGSESTRAAVRLFSS